MRGHDQHPVGEVDGLGHVVSNVDHGFTRFPPHLGDQLLHLVAGHGVEGREGLVHEQHGRVVGEGARDGDPLLHAPRKVVRIGIRELFQLHQPELLQGDALALRFSDALHLQAEGDVAERRAPGKELGEILEHDAAILPVALDGLTADQDVAG
jgi:hypothetical protein